MKKAVIIIVILVVLGIPAYLLLGSKDCGTNNSETSSKPISTPAPKASNLDEAVQKAVEWIKGFQKADGGWGAMETDESDPGITGLMLKGLALNGIKPEANPWMQKAIDKLLTFQREDGSFCVKQLQTYMTAIVVSSLAIIDKEKYAKQIEGAKNFLLNAQFKPNDEREIEDWFVGGMTYNDGNGRPDLSVTILALEGLKEAGVPADDPAFQNALKFIQRCQNRSESNDMSADLLLTNDNGFFYTPGASGEGGGEDKEKKTLKSYGSMTYSGLLGYAYCNLTPDDPRVADTIKWIKNNYTFDTNPGTTNYRDGYYYYLMACAKAIEALKLTKLDDGKPLLKDLKEAIVKLQKPDGSWINSSSQMWWEGNAVLTTAYGLTITGHIHRLESE